jgi:hypothetical protein
MRETPPKRRPLLRRLSPPPRYEVDALHEAALLVHGQDHDLSAQGDDVVGAAAAGQADPRRVVAADRARVEVAVLVDLRPADEPDVEEPALGEEEHVRDARQHLGPVRGAHLVRRDRQLPGLPRRAHDAAFDHHGEPRRVGTLGKGGGEHGGADACEHGGAVRERAGAHDREQLVGAVGHDVSIRARAAASRRASSPNSAR